MKEFIIKPGFYEPKKAGKKQPGLDLTRAITDYLVQKGLATSEDCCAVQFGGGYTKFIPITGDTLTTKVGDNLIAPAGTLATLTVKLPASPVDGEIVTITFTKIITALTMDGNGNTLVGTAITAAAVGTRIEYKFYTGIGWVRVM